MIKEAGFRKDWKNFFPWRGGINRNGSMQNYA